MHHSSARVRVLWFTRGTDRRGVAKRLSFLSLPSIPLSLSPFLLLPLLPLLSRRLLSQSLPFSDHLHPLHPDERKNKSNVPHPCVRIDFFSLSTSAHALCPSVLFPPSLTNSSLPPRTTSVDQEKEQLCPWIYPTPHAMLLF